MPRWKSYSPPLPLWTWVERGATALAVLGGVAGFVSVLMVWSGSQAVQADTVQGTEARVAKLELRTSAAEARQAAQDTAQQQILFQLNEIRADVRLLVDKLIRRDP